MSLVRRENGPLSSEEKRGLDVGQCDAEYM